MFNETLTLIRWLGKSFMLGREAVSDFVGDFFYDDSDKALKVRKVYVCDVGDPPDSAMRRIGPDNADAMTQRGDFRRVTPNVNIGTWYWQAFCGLTDNDPGVGFTGRNAQIYSRTRGEQTPTSSGGSLHLASTPIGSTDPVDRIEIESDGTLNLSGLPTMYAHDVAYVRVRTSDGRIRLLVIQ